MANSSSSKKSDLCFPLTEAIRAYVAVRKVHDLLHRHVSKKLAKWELSVPKYGVIRQLYDHESLPLSEISNLIFRGNSNITTLINRMERDGFVERVDHDSDRRIKKFRLTEKGRQIAPKVIGEYRVFLHQMMNCLSPDEQQVLINLLSKINESIISVEADSSRSTKSG